MAADDNTRTTQLFDEAFNEASARTFTLFAQVECRGYEPLYEALSEAIAADPQMLAVAADCRAGQPKPNLFFGAVHYLLADEPGDPLAAYYVGLSTTAPLPPEGAYPAFRDFVWRHEARIREIIGSRIVQTNEVGRSAGFLPAFTYVAQRSGSRPLAVIEVGASGGLNLLLDRFFIDYGRLSWGDPASPVHISCELETAVNPPLAAGVPTIAYRIGIDLNPIDLDNAQAVRWLQALVWPSIPERTTALRGAIELARQSPPRVLKGDANELLPGVIAAVPDDLTLVVLHSHTLNQFPADARDRFHGILREASLRRDIVRVGQEGQRPNGINKAHIWATFWRDGVGEDVELAQCHAHGRFLEWYPL